MKKVAIRKKHVRRIKTGKTTSVRTHAMKVPCPGSKIRSNGKGRGLGHGKGVGPLKGMTAYCVKCQQMRPILNPHVVVKGNRTFVQGTCPVCGTKLSRTVSAGV